MIPNGLWLFRLSNGAAMFARACHVDHAERVVYAHLARWMPELVVSGVWEARESQIGPLHIVLDALTP